MSTQIERYLSYIDREAPVMGILCGFCVTVLGFLWKEIGTVGKDTFFYEIHQQPFSLAFIAVGSGALIFAAVLFYRQRSRLLSIYGEICLHRPEATDDEQMAKWKEAIEGCFRFYKPAFAWMSVGLGFWLAALIAPAIARIL